MVGRFKLKRICVHTCKLYDLNELPLLTCTPITVFPMYQNLNVSKVKDRNIAQGYSYMCIFNIHGSVTHLTEVHREKGRLLKLQKHFSTARKFSF